MAIHVQRREFIVTLGGAVATTCPLVAQAQQTVRVLRVGFVGGQPPDAAIYVAFRKRMAELGYREGTLSSNTSRRRASMPMTRAFANSRRANLTL
jgi:hypothetical protein